MTSAAGDDSPASLGVQSGTDSAGNRARTSSQPRPTDPADAAGCLPVSRPAGDGAGPSDRLPAAAHPATGRGQPGAEPDEGARSEEPSTGSAPGSAAVAFESATWRSQQAQGARAQSGRAECSCSCAPCATPSSRHEESTSCVAVRFLVGNGARFGPRAVRVFPCSWFSTAWRIQAFSLRRVLII